MKKWFIILSMSMWAAPVVHANGFEVGIGIGDGQIIIGEGGVRIEDGHRRRPGGGYRRGPGHRHPGRGGWDHPRISCQAFDKGWEEHFGGHDTCHECLRKHGNCMERCSEEQFVATARGYDRRGRPDRDAFDVDGWPASDRWQAEDSALDSCYRRGLSGCYVVNMRTEVREVSRRSCR